MQLGSARCATCSGRGILTDVEGRPSPCVPCSSERRDESVRAFGYSLECNGCTAVLTVADMRWVKGQPRPRLVALYGPLCGGCVRESTERKQSA